MMQDTPAVAFCRMCGVPVVHIYIESLNINQHSLHPPINPRDSNGCQKQVNNRLKGHPNTGENGMKLNYVP